MKHIFFIHALVFINLACVLYTIGVWSEKLQHRLKWWHLWMFWCGFTFDTLGTTMMGFIAGTTVQFTFHGLTGLIAVILMLFHAIWATIVLRKNNEKLILKFHRFSIVVWMIWLVPMISGMIFGAGR